jgi:hypothetical protein
MYYIWNLIRKDEKLIIPMMIVNTCCFFEQVSAEKMYITVIAIAILCLA